MPDRSRRRIVTASLLLSATALSALPALAQDAPPSYAVISEMARKLNVVSEGSELGTRLDSNRKNTFTIQKDVLDRFALVTARSAIQKVSPSRVWLLEPAPTPFFDSLQGIGEGSRIDVPADLLQALAENKFSRLIVFTPYRADASIESLNSREGLGKLEGVGFYLNGTTETQRTDTLERSLGFLAPFVYFRATLIDPLTGRVLRTLTWTRAYMVSTAHSASAQIWQTMNAEEKSNALREMIGKGVDDLVPKLISP